MIPQQIVDQAQRRLMLPVFRIRRKDGVGIITET
jgi:hypothetical protein